MIRPIECPACGKRMTVRTKRHAIAASVVTNVSGWCCNPKCDAFWWRGVGSKTWIRRDDSRGDP